MTHPYDLAMEDLGTWEWQDGHNPKVVQYFSDVGHEWVQDDETAWCAAFVGAMLERSGVPSTRQLNARSYLNWGMAVPVSEMQPGDIIVFERGGRDSWKGHVGFVVKDAGVFVECLGGNQANQVNIKRYSKKKILGVRRYDQDTVESAGRMTNAVLDLVNTTGKPNGKKTTNWAAVASAGTGGVTAFAGLDWKVAVPVIAALAVLALYIIKERNDKSRKANVVRDLI